MPLAAGTRTDYGNLSHQERQRIDKFVELVDVEVAEAAALANLRGDVLRVLRPCNVAYVLTGGKVYAVATNVGVGGIVAHYYFEHSGEPLSGEQVVEIVERDIGFRESFLIEFFEVDLDDVGMIYKERAAQGAAQRYIKGELARVDRMKRIVRINPIFRGRDFMIDDSLVFVFCPFKEPFNTFYRDHIKAVVDQVPGMVCKRADDIFDNQAVIEDIWRSTNEARVIVADLTERNPNVLYEVGIAHTVGKEVILISQSSEDIPFDLRHLRYIVYDRSYQGALAFMQSLKTTLETVLNRTG